MVLRYQPLFQIYQPFLNFYQPNPKSALQIRQKPKQKRSFHHEMKAGAPRAPAFILLYKYHLPKNQKKYNPLSL
jgi:hypothetical protein